MILAYLGLLLLTNVILIFGFTVLAYLDPGSGSFLIQLLIGGLVGLLAFIKAYWTRIQSFFRKPNEDRPEDSEELFQIKSDLENEQN